MWFCMVLQFACLHPLPHCLFSCIQGAGLAEAGSLSDEYVNHWKSRALKTETSMNSPDVFPNAYRDCACCCHLYRNNKCFLQFCVSRFSNNHHGLYGTRTRKCFQKVYVKNFYNLVDKKHIRPMMTKSKTDRCCGQSTNGASRVVIEVKDAPSTFRVSTAQGRTKGSRFQYPSWRLLLNQKWVSLRWGRLGKRKDFNAQQMMGDCHNKAHPTQTQTNHECRNGIEEGRLWVRKSRDCIRHRCLMRENSNLRKFLWVVSPWSL